jgi:pimeloyl-ACP methyl ester carboxylesterase
MYPFTRQTDALSASHRIVIPDRGGYGRSTRLVGDLPSDFHYRAAVETLALIDWLGIERAVFWGHSDGAVIAAILGFTAPERTIGLILEAFHYNRLKPTSKRFFETLAHQPEALGEELCERFAREHGADCWRHLITTHARAWLQIAVESIGAADDLYSGRLSEITAPTLFVHGRLDPRTEAHELDAVRGQLPHAEMQILDEAAHSPHSESATAEVVTGLASEFIRRKVFR